MTKESVSHALPSEERVVLNSPERASRRVTVLFVEDEPAYLGAIFAAIDRYEPSWAYEVLDDAKLAHEWLCRNCADVIVIDAMLPAVPGAPPHSEGAYLARLVRDVKSPLPHNWVGSIRDENRRSAIVLLTARSAQGLRQVLQDYKLEPVVLDEPSTTDFLVNPGRKIGVVEKGSALAEGTSFLERILRPVMGIVPQGGNRD